MITKRIIKKINKYDVVSFDIFDTLIEREVDKPIDIFYLTGCKFFDENGAKLFQNARIRAERLAREKSNSGEVTLEDIYKYIDGYDQIQINNFMNMEQEIELNSCYSKVKINPIYRWAIDNGKKVILISDMYLSKKQITKMLSKCGIDQYSNLYVSNNHSKNKLTGELFDVAINELEIDKKNMIHIGDSIKADYIGARKAGVSSILIGRKNRIGRLIR